MSMSHMLNHYLKQSHIPYETISHKHTTNAHDSACTARVPTRHLAKAVILEDDEGNHLMAVIPASNKVKISWINNKLGGHYHLASEGVLRDLFQDCEWGAIPATGPAFKIKSIWDDELSDIPDIYIEAGDHVNLLKIQRDRYMSMMSGIPHDHISVDNGCSSPYHTADTRFLSGNA